MNGDKKDLATEVLETIRNRPVESIIAYNLLLSEQQKKKVNEAILVYLLTYFLLGLLGGPFFYDKIAHLLYENDFFGEIKTEEDVEKKLKPQLEGLKIL